MYSAYKLNKQGNNIQSWRTPFPIWIQPVVPCPVLTVASWLAYRFLKRQVRWLVQDLQIINEAVVPLHPVVPNPCTLSKIPEWAKYFSVIDLKDAFYSIPLAEESQFVFVFEDPTQPASQLTWIVLHQGFHDSPHLFGQSLSQDIQNFNSPKAVALQYIDDNLLCGETEEACSQVSEDFLNFLTGCGYKASREKAQLCQQSVKYLSLIISEGMRAIGPERIKSILNHPLPMTLRQLRGFLDITGYCHIWIPGYGQLAWPLYKLVTETTSPNWHTGLVSRYSKGF